MSNTKLGQRSHGAEPHSEVTPSDSPRTPPRRASLLRKSAPGRSSKHCLHIDCTMRQHRKNQFKKDLVFFPPSFFARFSHRGTDPTLCTMSASRGCPRGWKDTKQRRRRGRTTARTYVQQQDAQARNDNGPVRRLMCTYLVRSRRVQAESGHVSSRSHPPPSTEDSGNVAYLNERSCCRGNCESVRNPHKMCSSNPRVINGWHRGPLTDTQSWCGRCLCVPTRRSHVAWKHLSVSCFNG